METDSREDQSSQSDIILADEEFPTAIVRPIPRRKRG